MHQENEIMSLTEARRVLGPHYGYMKKQLGVSPCGAASEMKQEIARLKNKLNTIKDEAERVATERRITAWERIVMPLDIFHE